MEDHSVLKFAVNQQSGEVKIFSATFPKWNLPVVGDNILVSESKVVFTIIGKTHVFENGAFKEILYAVSKFEPPQ